MHSNIPPRSLPWSPDGNADAATTMNLLGGMLQVELRQEHAHLPKLPQHSVHPPTLMSAIGAIAGYAAQCAAAHAIQTKQKPLAPDDLVKVNCKDGSALYFGNEINRHLILDPRGAYALSGFLAGAVINAGHTPAELPNAAEILNHVSTVACTPEYDTVRAPAEYQPTWNISQILKAIWPKARMILEHRIDAPTIKQPLNIQYWPILASIVAQQYIGMAKDLIPPPTAMAIILESAVKASKRRLIGQHASPLAAHDEIFFPPR